MKRFLLYWLTPPIYGRKPTWWDYTWWWLLFTCDLAVGWYLGGLIVKAIS